MTVKVRHKMTSFTRFDALKRARPYQDYSRPDLKFNHGWKIAGGISFYYGSPEDDVWVHVPPEYDYAGPVIPGCLRSKIKPDNPIFKAGILHEYLRNKCWMRIKGVRIQVNQEDADEIFLAAMEVAGVSWWKRYFYYYAARLTPRYFSESVVFFDDPDKWD